MQNTKGKKVAVVIGATSKWQADGRMTNMLHGGNIDPNVVPVGVQWGVGGAVAQKFAAEGFFTVVTTRTESNASGLAAAIRDQGGESMVVELDLSSEDSITNAFKTIRAEAGEPDAVIYNAGYLDGRELPADKELLEHVPTSILDTAIHVAVRGPFLVAKEVLPAMRKKGEGSFLF
jgi:NAD(P)-dependent dehydrogenase (short-subunit alcohol dehydrogenase family)